MTETAQEPPERCGPLVGLRVLEMGAIGPVPFAAGLLADLGAECLRIESPGPEIGVADEKSAIHLRGRSWVRLNLREPSAVDLVRELAATSDVLLEGFRPGVMERLGLDPADLIAANRGLIVGRMTGWGQSGPMSDVAGHDINYIAVAGPLRHFARAGQTPVAPLNLVGDLGGGAMFLVTGVLAALFERSRSGRGQVIDAAMVDGSAYLMNLIYAMAAQGMWAVDRPGTNLLDTGAPFYDVYRCSDGEYLAVGCLEPKFYAEFVAGLGLADEDLPAQYDADGWDELRRVFTRVIASRPRDEWDRAFEGKDACVAGVRSMAEATTHPHMTARGTFLEGPPIQPAPAPRFSRTPGMAVPRGSLPSGAEALIAWGVDADRASQMCP
ncbi:MAG: CaiB/BaiF CoA-transferase family protein [Candidatus Nanopelagicales bacterium]|nr:CaiB/BaiF CoA-transferase family protein [Candidatus Nanopelagicales bacterium]MDZ4250842.1 CaiB/BaiF CoA-transferase family protein [Candidatus Nanopelagicales bacterium]